jgi:predicted nuclease of predicted toxin-antitoxin system
MRFLIDENLPSAEILNLTGDFVHARDLGSRLTDSELWDHAREHRLVLVTKDADFSYRLALYGSPPKVVWIRFGNMRLRDMITLLRRAWPAVQRHVPEAELILVFRDRVDYRL